MPGVHAVITADDLPEPMRNDPLPLLLPNPALVAARTQRALARDEVCYVGQPVAVVIADTRYLAEDAAAALIPQYDVLPAAVGLPRRCRRQRAARAQRSRLECRLDVSLELWRRRRRLRGRRACFQGRALAAPRRRHGDGDARGARHHEPVSDLLTVWSGTQTPHIGRRMLADLLGRDLQSIRMIAPDVGGGFGPKAIFYPEEAVIPAAALKLGRPVKWIEDRREHFLSRDPGARSILAGRDRGRRATAKILGVRGRMLHDSGAFVPWGIVMPYIAASTVPGPYVIPAYRSRNDGRAHQQGADHAGARRRPAAGGVRHGAAAGPRRPRTETRSRRGAPPQFDPARANALRGRPHLPRRQAAGLRQRRLSARTGEGAGAGRHTKASASGRKRRSTRAASSASASPTMSRAPGIGPFEGVTVRVLPNGKVAVATGATNQGQGTRTTLSQIVAEQVGCRLEDIVMTIGDTGAIAQGVGAFASRQAVNAGSLGAHRRPGRARADHRACRAHARRRPRATSISKTARPSRSAATSRRSRSANWRGWRRAFPAFRLPAGQAAGHRAHRLLHADRRRPIAPARMSPKSRSTP